MSISKRTAQRLVKSGKATITGTVYDGLHTYLVVQRLDLQRTDHVLLGAGDLR